MCIYQKLYDIIIPYFLGQHRGYRIMVLSLLVEMASTPRAVKRTEREKCFRAAMELPAISVPITALLE